MEQLIKNRQLQQVLLAPSQVVKLEPVAAHIVGSGTSAVLLRGEEQAGGVRITPDRRETSGSPLLDVSTTAVS